MGGFHDLKTTPVTSVIDLKKSSVTADIIIASAEPQSPVIPIFSRFDQLDWIVWPEDDAGDAGGRLEEELGHQKLHHRVRRARKLFHTKFLPIPPT